MPETGNARFAFQTCGFSMGSASKSRNFRKRKLRTKLPRAGLKSAPTNDPSPALLRRSPSPLGEGCGESLDPLSRPAGKHCFSGPPSPLGRGNKREGVARLGTAGRAPARQDESANPKSWGGDKPAPTGAGLKADATGTCLAPLYTVVKSQIQNHKSKIVAPASRPGGRGRLSEPGTSACPGLRWVLRPSPRTRTKQPPHLAAKWGVLAAFLRQKWSRIWRGWAPVWAKCRISARGTVIRWVGLGAQVKTGHYVRARLGPRSSPHHL